MMEDDGDRVHDQLGTVGPLDLKSSGGAILFAMSLVAALSGGARADDDGDDEGGGNARPKLDGEIKEIIKRIDPARIQNGIEKLATFQTRNSCSTNLAPNPGKDNGTKGISPRRTSSSRSSLRSRGCASPSLRSSTGTARLR